MKNLWFILFTFFKVASLSASLPNFIAQHHGLVGCVIGWISQEDFYEVMDDAYVQKLYVVVEPDDVFYVEQLPNECPGCVEIIVVPYDQAADVFEDNMFDFVYIADPEYDPVYIDVWMHKVRSGGVVGGVNGTRRDDGITRQWTQHKEHILSFIIPTYNRAHTIRDAIDSIYAQTNLKIPFEVVVTDDGSTDNTIAILQEYTNKYDNFSFYVHEKNLGPSKARNTCIAHARGDLIFNVDSDNILENNSVQQLIDALDVIGCQAVAFGQVNFFKTPGECAWSWEIQSTNGICTLSDGLPIKHTVWLMGNYLFTRKSYERAGRYQGRSLETWRFGLRQFISGTQVVVVPNTYYWHRLSPDSNLRQRNAGCKNGRAVMREFKKYPELFTHETQELMKTHDNYNLKHAPFELLPDEQLCDVLDRYRIQLNRGFLQSVDQDIN